MTIHPFRSRLPYLLLFARLVGNDEVPTELINQPNGGDPNGPCSLCRVKTIKDTEDTSKGGARLELYYDDEQAGRHTNIALTSLLANGEYRYQLIEGVDLIAGHTSSYELRPGDDWDWADDVEYLWVEVTDVRP